MQQGLSGLKSFILFQDCLYCAMSHELPYKCVDLFSNICDETSWNIDKACVESVRPIWEVSHSTILSLLMYSPLFRSNLLPKAFCSFQSVSLLLFFVQFILFYSSWDYLKGIVFLISICLPVVTVLKNQWISICWAYILHTCWILLF